MAHDHTHTENNIKIAFFLNLAFTLIEIVGGVFTNSLAILSDALHDLGDSLSLGLSWYFHRVSHRKRDNAYSYGYKRFSILGAVINSIVLTVGSIYILLEAIPRILNPETVKADGMILLAVIGILANGIAVFRLAQGSSLNEKVVKLHLMEDVLGWVAVLVASIVMKFWNIPVLDPLLSLGISVYILINVFRNMKEAIRIILQGIPMNTAIKPIEQEIRSFEDVLDVHDIHLWTLDGEYHVLSVHIVVPKEKKLESLTCLKEGIREVLKSYHIKHVTIEFEPEGEKCCMQEC